MIRDPRGIPVHAGSPKGSGRYMHIFGTAKANGILKYLPEPHVNARIYIYRTAPLRSNRLRCRTARVQRRQEFHLALNAGTEFASSPSPTGRILQTGTNAKEREKLTGTKLLRTGALRRNQLPPPTMTARRPASRKTPDRVEKSGKKHHEPQHQLQ